MNLQVAWVLAVVLLMLGSLTGCADKPVADPGRPASVTDKGGDKTAAEVYDRGLDYAHQGEFDKAIADFTEAIRLDSEQGKDAYYDRGVAYDKIGEYEKAIADFTKAISLDAEYAPTYNNRGVAYIRTGEYDKAIADFTEVIRIIPEDARAYFNRGLPYEKKGDQEKAEADFAKAKELGYEKK